MNIEQVWPEWQVDRLIGKGSYGAVYRCMKAGDKGKEYAAVKVISVPQDDFEAESVGSEGMSGEQSREYYKDITDNFINEIKILEALKDEKHIVNIQDSKVVEKEDGIGWQIFIRMELLTDFNTYASDKTFTPDAVRRLALDLCDALIVCGKKRIVHRDIKPENIFVDAEGNFKLGDFGVAKQLEKTYASMSTKGTYNYMAPEVVASKKYDSRADIYSLGMVMYKLLNNNRLPFLDPEKKLIRFSERQEAFERRIKGEKIPPIPGVDDDLNEIILKACKFRADDRYRTVEEFRAALAKEKPSSRFVRIVKKHKVVSAIIFLLVVSIISGSCGYAFSAGGVKRKTPYPEKQFAAVNNKKIVSLNGTGIVCDSVGIWVVNEVDEKKDFLLNAETSSMAFNGQEVCFSHFIGNSRVQMTLMDIHTKKVLFSLQSENRMAPVFFDENNLFYFDIMPDLSFYLRRYTFKTKENKRFDTLYDSHVLDSWSFEQIDNHSVLIYAQQTSDDQNDLNLFDSIDEYALDLYAVEEGPHRIISDGSVLCADRSYLYYMCQHGLHCELYRCQWDGQNAKRVLRVPVTEILYWVMGGMDASSLSTGAGSVSFVDLDHIIPINHSSVGFGSGKKKCVTYYDVYTGQKQRVVLKGMNVHVISAEDGFLGCCFCYFNNNTMDMDGYETGYVLSQPVSGIGIFKSPSKTYRLSYTEDQLYSIGLPLINRYGAYSVDSNGMISFKKAEIRYE